MSLRDLIRFRSSRSAADQQTTLTASIDDAAFQSVGTSRMLPAILEMTMQACTEELTKRFLAQHADTILASLDPTLVEAKVVEALKQRLVEVLTAPVKEPV